jgi:hypothetical protein
LSEALESAIEVAARFDADRRDDATPETLRKAFERTLSVNVLAKLIKKIKGDN